MMNNLTKRQQAILSVCKKSEKTVDVGCDHGYIGVNLLKTNKTKFLIATDISAPSAKKTEKLLKESNLSSKASVRVGDGLETIKSGEIVDQVIIAGMGGKEIIHILSSFKNTKNIKHIVLQPMNELLSVRKYLSENQLKIKKDIVFFDKKFYHIITVSQGNSPISLFKQKWGAKTKDRNKDYFLWIKHKEEKIIKILSGIKSTNEKYKIFMSCLNDIKKIKATKGAKTC